MRSTWLVVLALVAGCDGIDLGELVPSHAARTRIAPEPPGAHCPHGGQAVLSGLDLDDDGVLDDGEVTTTEYACTTVLVYSQPEPEGPHCEHGGRAVHTGPDTDADGQLDDGEVTATEYVCATAIPDVLVRTRQLPPGEKCPNGGQVSHAGRDVDGNGLLDDGEISREVYGCMEPAPVLARVLPLAVPPPGCRKTSSLLEAGVDEDEDGVLDDAEARASLRMCLAPEAVFLLQRPEPAGVRCPTGGTAVGAGLDLNEDAKLSPNEVLVTAYVCQPTATYEGTYQVRNAADLAALQAISHIKGGLDITDSDLAQVELPGLVSVEGSLNIARNPSLTVLNLLGLRSVSEAVVIANNDNLEVLGLGPSGPIPAHVLRIGTDLTLDTNARLTTLFGLSAALPRQSVKVARNALLVGGDGPRYLVELSGDLDIVENPRLESLGAFGELEKVGGRVLLFNNAALTSLAGLEKLKTVASDVVINDNDALLSVAALSALERIGGRFEASDNNSMLTLELPALVHAGNIELHWNYQLETVGPMPSLEAVDGIFSINSNDKLVGVTGMPRLVHLGGGLGLSGNALLEDLSGFSQLLRLQQLGVSSNNALTSLAQLNGLRELGRLTVQDNRQLVRLDLDGLVRVTQSFQVVDNPKLPGCLATSLATAVYTGPSEERIIERNADTPCGL
ncbi:DUF7151 family protein [Pyxidicoccus sp. MSG2]|uniref:DUF7151 family protein n=1 Tax=Pyxidicoccus sp. MSG2 TaxID=2996790 RepID=UPI00226FC4DA|nr:hypothetical protein [Pyxidicoccus sp. MSG2]MCY1019495.1 hypothetical protein [Pyxidicoccus sp. MSG2]